MNVDLNREVVRRLDAVEAMLPDLEQMLVSMQQGDLDIGSKTNEVDLVTKADYASERHLMDFLRERFPEDGIVSEEGSQSAAEAERRAAFQWILDPVDGTVNYANRLSCWAVSVGLVHEGVQVGGIVTAPAQRERFRAVKDAGATLNGRSIRVNPGASLREGLVGTGFPYDRAKRADPLSRALSNMLRESGGVRRLGAAALDFCYLADGRFLGYYEMGLKPWDSAAGALIAREAGATVTDLSGGPFDIFTSTGVLASNGKVHAALVQAARPMLEAVAI